MSRQKWPTPAQFALWRLVYGDSLGAGLAAVRHQQKVNDADNAAFWLEIDEEARALEGAAHA